MLGDGFEDGMQIWMEWTVDPSDVEARNNFSSGESTANWLGKVVGEVEVREEGCFKCVGIVEQPLVLF